MKELRDYQKKIVDDVIVSDRDLLICLPTGGGKTVIASAIMQKLDGLKVFVVPRLELIQQASDEFGDVDIIWADKTKLTGKDIVIASKSSLESQSNLIPEDKDLILIFDEAHIGIEQTCHLVQRLNPKRVLGLTATPERMDGLALLKGDDSIHRYGVFDSLYQAETVPSLQRMGYLAKLHYYTKPIENITKIKPDNSLGEELSEKQIRSIFDENHIWGDLVKCYELYGKGRPAIGFTTTVQLADSVAKIFQDAGYNFKTIHGEMPIRERQQLIEDLKTGKIDGLVNAALLTYGFDCPEASYAFSCRHIKSRPLWFQMIGRILRPCEGKKDAVFIDHGDSISEFSEPDCALPVLDELIRWKADGETKAQKAERKKRIKRAQDTMKDIQELDPLPVDMIEITTEHTYDRLLRVLSKLRDENGSLKATLTRQQNEIQSLHANNEALQKQVKRKFIDTDQTFNYVKSHYCVARRNIEYYGIGLTAKQAHERTIQRILSAEKDLPFLFDKETLSKGFEYWKDHYQQNYKRPGQNAVSVAGKKKKEKII